MKTTICITKQKRLVVRPMEKVSEVCLEIQGPGQGADLVYLKLDQVGALLFALEQAAEALDLARVRAEAAAQCAL